DIRFELANVGTHGANVVVRKRVLDRRIDLFPRDLALVALRIPDLDGEDRPILDPARHQSRPVVALRTVEAERDGIAVFERTKIRIKAPIPFRRSDPTVLSGIDLVQKLASRLGDVVLDVENRLDQRVDI